MKTDRLNAGSYFSYHKEAGESRKVVSLFNEAHVGPLVRMNFLTSGGEKNIVNPSFLAVSPIMPGR
jgi:hypothetical protein